MTNSITSNPTTVTLSPTNSSNTVISSSVTSGITSQYILGASNGTSWSDLSAVTISSTPSTTHPSLQVNGNAEFKGDITVKGRNLMESLDRIEKRLNILTANPRLESQWEKLKQLGDEYRALEADILEKEEIIKILSQ